MKNSKYNSIEMRLMNRISSSMKEKVGRGPRDIKIHISGNVLVILIYGVLSTLEKNILKSPDGKRVILEGRKIYLDMENTERLADYEKILGATIIEHFETYNPHNDSAASVIVCDKNLQ